MALSKLTDLRKSLSAEVNNLKVSGISTFTGDVSIGGTLTYEDVTNIDSVGIITARSGILVSSGSSIGIGTDKPDTPLHIQTSSNSNKFITLSGGNEKRNNYIGINAADNLEIAADEDNQGSSSSIRFRIDGSEVVRFHRAGRIGINTDSPQGDLHIVADNPNIEFNDTNTGSNGEITLDNTALRIEVDEDNTINNSKIEFRVDTSEKLNIDSSGNTTITDGNLVIGTSGHGIDFSAAGNVGGMTSELLDDYEEGSFNPTLVNGNNGYRFQIGTYTKIGNLVTFTAYIETSATPPSGNLAFGNLPFTSIGGRSWVFPFHTNRTAFGTNSFDARAYMGGTDTNIYIYYPVNSSSSNFQPINQNGMNAANASAVWISGSYQTAS